MANRPLSPHLFDGFRLHWRWGPHMLISILHRVTGAGFAVVGLPIMLWWLGALASGPAAYATFTDWVWADLGTLEWSGIGAIIASLVKLAFKIALIGLSWAFFQHTMSGLRHFVLDIGAGFELETNKRWSIISMVLGVVFTALFWAAIILF